MIAHPNPEPDVSKSGWWFLSFCDNARPAGQQWTGVCAVQGSYMIDALRAAWALRVNPGGEALGTPIPQDKIPAAEFRNKLLTTREQVALAFNDPIEDYLPPAAN